MLIQFRAENFLSIKGSVVLSLLASKDKEHPKHLIVNGSKRYLKSAGIYGANASGKSNVLHAFWFMVNYVLTSHNQQLHKAIERSPFKFDRETPVRPSSFEVIFTANGIRYAYGFSVTDKVVIEEYLYCYPNGRQAIIFERQNTNDFRFTVDVDEQSMLKNRTSPNKLYLSVASNWSYSKVIPVLEWFASCRIITKHSAADAVSYTHLKVLLRGSPDWLLSMTAFHQMAHQSYLAISAICPASHALTPVSYTHLGNKIGMVLLFQCKYRCVKLNMLKLAPKTEQDSNRCV